MEKKALIEREIKRVNSVNISPDSVNDYLISQGTEPLSTGAKLSQLIRRPQLSYDGLAPFDDGRPELPDDVREQVELSVKYEGYIKIQLEQIESMRKLESKPIPTDIDYAAIRGLRLEAAEKLNRIRPTNLGQASRISGVNPADISVLLIWLNSRD